MERKPPSSLGDLVAIVKRRKFWIIVPFLAFVVVGVALSPLVPRSYQSTTTLLVVPQKVSAAYVRPSTIDVANRLQSIELRVTNGPGLIDIINRLNLYPDLRKKDNPGQLIAKMRKDLTVAVAPDSTDARGNVGAFTISYVGLTPRLTQQATRQIAQLFVDENAREGALRAQGTDAFLAAQLAEAQRQLAAQQAKIQAFKDAHRGSLPEQAQATLAMVNQYQTELQANSAAIEQDNQERVSLQSVLNVSPDGAGAGDAAPDAATPLQIELAEKQAELHADLLKDTPQHPDVIRLEHEVAALKAQEKTAPKSHGVAVAVPAAVATTGPSQTALLRGQLIGLNTDIKERTRRQAALEQRINQMQGSVSGVPAVETEFASLDAAYLEMQKNYNTLVEKKQEASMAAQLVQGNGGEQFVVLDPASYPATSYRPDPVLLYLGIVMIGLLLGFVWAAAVELRDDTIHTAEEAADYLKLPVIVALPKYVAESGH